MAALYPVSVHTYTAHRDAVEYILADHVNSLQDEVTAIETALGTHPTAYTAPTDYSTLGKVTGKISFASVRDRLDVLQAHIAALEGAADVTVIRSPLQPFPWPNPVAVIRNPGQSITASPVQWTSYDMSTADFDSDGLFTGGSSLTSPQTGWWQIAASVITDVPPGDTNVTHTVANRIMIANQEVASQASSRPLGSAQRHRVNLTYAGPWNAGDPLLLQARHTTPDSSSVASSMLISATYLRQTV